MFRIKDSVALVTGANRGMGARFADELVQRGARRVYAAARKPASVDGSSLVPVRLDVTKQVEIDDLARDCGDVNLLINNAGIALTGTLLGDDPEEALRHQLETNFFGMLRMSRAFAPVLARNGGGAVLNMLSVVSWAATPAIATYAVSKAAAWSLTNSLRLEFKAQGTQVTALHASFIDTDLTGAFDVPKADPAVVVASALDALESGLDEVFVDDPTRGVHGGLSQSSYLRDLMGF
jgi:NAD(P)-dependent dehydrogenase (short-subunit alcohol dehydrogenase family)